MPNLLQYVNSGNYYCRIKVGRKLYLLKPARPGVATHGVPADRGPLDREVQELRSQLVQVRGDVESLSLEFQRLQADFQRLRAELGG